ncbi:hypothetical protein [Lysinibacillus sp. fls2-241-R2A-57]|uniref:hypothetical protein n=1 Tax=Lysinibacillus sp. fls2-241-R2A-57 TaxID=3040292 RepID=UPI0025545A45|nr:hypothetical protein [Lysinibacillus sp. fls2-241-R2A-57]
MNEKDFNKKRNKFLTESPNSKGKLQIITLDQSSSNIFGLGNQCITPTSLLIYQKSNNRSELQGYIGDTVLAENISKTILLNMKDSVNAKVYIQNDNSYQKIDFNSDFSEEDLLMIYWECAPFSLFYYVFKDQYHLYCETIFNKKSYPLQSFSRHLLLNALTNEEKQKIKNLFNSSSNNN